jgi:hypothetical protein
MRRALAQLRTRHPNAAAIVEIAGRIDAFDTVGVSALASAAMHRP